MGFTSFDNLDFASSSPDLEDMVRGELADNEKLVWVGRPRVGRMVQASLPIFALGIFFESFAIFGMIQASSAGRFAFFGLPFIAIGLCMLASPIWAGWRAARTYYAVTDRRAIIGESGLWDGLQVRNYGPERLGSMSRNQRGDGSGDLIFEEIATYTNRNRSRITRRGFFAIDDVRKIEALIRSTLLHD